MEEFFDDTMNNEFNVLLDDDSSLTIARNVLKYFKMYKCGQHFELNCLINEHELKSKNKSTGIKQSNGDDVIHFIFNSIK